jgi:hypothetical protein
MNYKLESFLNNCDPVDLQYLVEWVKDSNLITEKDFLNRSMSAGEEYFENSLSKIRGKWNQLSKEEEDFILNLAKRF